MKPLKKEKPKCFTCQHHIDFEAATGMRYVCALYGKRIRTYKRLPRLRDIKRIKRRLSHFSWVVKFFKFNKKLGHHYCEGYLAGQRY